MTMTMVRSVLETVNSVVLIFLHPRLRLESMSCTHSLWRQCDALCGAVGSEVCETLRCVSRNRPLKILNRQCQIIFGLVGFNKAVLAFSNDTSLQFNLFQLFESNKV